jgi:phosphohistidine phosphatase
MRLYLVQHGEAKSKAEDPERPLTEKGMLAVAKMAAFLKPMELSVKVMWHSGKTRALQTAELLSQAFAAEEGTVRGVGLSPNDEVRPVAEQIAETEGDLLIVGHLPSLARLASLLVAGKPDAGAVAFTNGGVVCLERDENSWSLKWAITPELLP